MKNWAVILIFLTTIGFSQGQWFHGNLKGIDDISLQVNLKGVDDDVWLNRVRTFIELKFSEEDIFLSIDSYPKLVVDIHVIDSRVQKTSSFFVVWALYNYSISEKDYYRSIADTLIAKRLMTNRIYSAEILGQTHSQKLYGDVEKSLGKLFNQYIDYWYRDNPLKQF